MYYATYDYISMHNHDTGTSSDALLAGTVVGNQGFMNNTLWYTSPKFGGVTIDFAFSLLGEERIDPSMDQPRHIGLVGSYDAARCTWRCRTRIPRTMPTSTRRRAARGQQRHRVDHRRRV